MKTQDKTIVSFHIGRGGHFHNQGYLTFTGKYTIQELIRHNDSNLFIGWENEREVIKKIGDRSNLMEKFHTCRDNEDFSFFSKLGLEIGEKGYSDGNGNFMISDCEIDNGTGALEFDGDYDTSYATFLEDLDEEEIAAVQQSSEWCTNEILEELVGLGLIEKEEEATND